MAGDSQIHAFFGTDEARVKEAAHVLARKLVPQDDEFGLEVIQGGADNSDHARRIVAARAIDPTFAEALERAEVAGVRVLGRRCRVDWEGIELRGRVPAGAG